VRNTTQRPRSPAAAGGVRSKRMRGDTIKVEVEPDELRETEPGIVDVFDALSRQFFWADVVMVAARDLDADVLIGEVVYMPQG
jgi:hypothetical protein